MGVIIEGRDVGKRFRLGLLGADIETFREFLIRMGKAPFRAIARRGRPEADQAGDFWALRNIDFDVEEGQVVGIIGRNGAGKSTLLKILSRITEPTEGVVKIRGRLASLLEVGTGFHPELTGRENVFLNGAILGMRRAEIKAKFDEIVAFAEIERFLDTPVKRYSSGMYVRLAFAVAAHLDPEILVVDEVLAVGDVAFQKKCLGKMSQVSRGGRTVLFVSHNMAAVEGLCEKGMVLARGEKAFDGPVKDAIEFYLDSMKESATEAQANTVDLTEAPSRPAKYRKLFKRLAFYTAEERPLDGGLPVGGPLKVAFAFDLGTASAHFDIFCWFETLFGQIVFTTSSLFEPDHRAGNRQGLQEMALEIPSLTLMPGEYRLKIQLNIAGQAADLIDDAARLTVLPGNYYGSGRMPTTGVFVLEHHWSPI